MTYIKILTALTALALLTACGGATPTTKTTTPIDPCIANPFVATCDATAPTIIAARELVCLDNANASPLCTGDNGIIDTFCKANPFDLRIGCRSENYASFRQTACLNAPTADTRCTETDGILDTFCTENPFDSRIGCTDAAYNRARQAACEIDDKNRAECIPTVMRICVGNSAFSLFCNDTPNILDSRITACIMGDNANRPQCNGLFSDAATNNCIDNPFTPACGQEDSDFADYAETARTNRARFCDTNIADPFCIGNNVALVCAFDPLTAICLNAPVAVRIGACGLRANAERTPCTASILSNPNAATWAQSFETPLRTTATAENQFLRGGVENLESGGGGNIRLQLSNVNVMAYGSVSSNSGQNHYAGLLSGLNLVAPLTETEGTVTWAGAIGAIGTGIATTARAADIEINFALKTIEVFAQAGANNSTFHYLITGSYDDLGVITGRGTNPVTYANFGGTLVSDVFTGNRTMIVDGQLYGQVTGIIGQTGVVGAFISNADADTSYSGGFVAAKP